MSPAKRVPPRRGKTPRQKKAVKKGKPAAETLPIDSKQEAQQNLLERAQDGQLASLLSAIVDSSDDGIVSKKLDGTITSWNKSAERLFGYKAEEAIGQNINIIIPADREDEERGIIEQIKRGERVDHIETVRRRKDGSLIELSVTISPVKNAKGRIIGASKVARDITDRKRIELERQKFVTLADRCTEFIGMCDMEFRPFYANEAAMRLVGLDSLEQLRSTRVEDFFFPEDRPYVSDKFLPQVIRDGRGEVEIRFRHVKNGKAIWMIYNVFVVKDTAGKPVAIATFSQNINKRKEAEEAVRKSEMKLRILSETLDNEVRTRTKELEQRNAEVVEGAEKLRDLTRRMMRIQDNERRRIARELHDSAGQLLAALGMNLSRLVETVRPELKNEAKSAEDLVQQLTKEIRTTSYLLHPPLLDEIGLSGALSWYVQGLIERSHLDIQLKIADDLGRLSADLELVIFRLVQECLTNVHRHSGSKSATIDIERQGENVCLTVQDQGKGINPQKLAEIQTQASGLGIRGMRERVHQFGGELNIESSESGTKIVATIPVLHS